MRSERQNIDGTANNNVHGNTARFRSGFNQVANVWRVRDPAVSKFEYLQIRELFSKTGSFLKTSLLTIGALERDYSDSCRWD